MTAPLIAVTTWRRPLPTPLGAATELDTLGTEYSETVRAAGGVPVLLPPLSPDELKVLLDRVDGVLLSGGQDLVEGQTRDAASADDLERDATEFAVLDGARRRGLPVFGICRGLQAINVHLGGTLIQNLPNTAAHPTIRSDEDQNARRHLIGATAPWIRGSLPEGGIVNSIHHQAIDELAPGLCAVAWAADDTVEAVEATELADGTGRPWFVRAVQWHPEKLPGAEGRMHSNRLLADFIAAAQSSGVGATGR